MTKTTKNNQSLECILENQKKNYDNSLAKTAMVDTGANITYSLVVGSILDHFSGLNLTGIIASRASSVGLCTIASAPYGWWREQMCKFTNTTVESGKVKKMLVDLLAYNIFQVPLYAVTLTIGNLVSEGKVDLEKITDGMTYLMTVSPLIAPTLGWYTDCFRKIFGVKSAAEGAYNKNVIQ